MFCPGLSGPDCDWTLLWNHRPGSLRSSFSSAILVVRGLGRKHRDLHSFIPHLVSLRLKRICIGAIVLTPGLSCRPCSFQYLLWKTIANQQLARLVTITSWLPTSGLLAEPCPFFSASPRIGAQADLEESLALWSTIDVVRATAPGQAVDKSPGHSATPITPGKLAPRQESGSTEATSVNLSHAHLRGSILLSPCKPSPRSASASQLCRVRPFASFTCMPPNAPEDLHRTIETLYRSESGRILATLVRLLGDLDLAEEAMHEAFAAALASWPQAGIPDNPRPWLISTARFKAIDGMRRRARFGGAQKDFALYSEARSKGVPQGEAPQEEEIEDDRLRLIFTCCHPALPPEGQVALTLREVCGLTTEEIARAFLVTPATLAQRIVRAKAVIRDKAIPYQVPVSQELSTRLGAVLQVVYLVFNAGYSAEATGAELSREAIRLGRLLRDLLPEPEVLGLLGLMLLQESRRAARTSAEGELILLDQQDRLLWNRDQIAEGIALTHSALASRRFGAYTLQAAIAAVHAESSSAASTDWRQITLLYDLLLRFQPSPVVELNRAVAIAMCDGPEAGLAHIDAVLEHGELENYYLAHSARADMYRRLGRTDEARSAYEKALTLTQQEPERHFLQERIRQLK